VFIEQVRKIVEFLLNVEYNKNKRAHKIKKKGYCYHCLLLEEHKRFEEINGLLINHTGRGVGKSAGKNKIVQNLLELGLNIPQSANHPDGTSAKYFIKRLTQVRLNSNF
jgi:hypothetical protein